jgi:hypothetical protein
MVTYIETGAMARGLSSLSHHFCNYPMKDRMACDLGQVEHGMEILIS